MLSLSPSFLVIIYDIPEFGCILIQYVFLFCCVSIENSST